MGPSATLGKYTLVAELARGGMGVVYLARISGPGSFQKLVVVKELKGELAEDPQFREMFLEEAKLGARLNHRNIVQTNEVGNEGDRYFIAMDYLEGCSLHAARRRLRGDAKLSQPMEMRILGEVLAGLHYAHELTDYDGSPLGVVHRDVGPQNVFLTFDGQVKLLDFGVAKANSRAQETQAGVLKGRVAYMAPEQVDGSGLDRRADIFAAGVMLREIVTGQRLWDNASEVDTLKRLIAREIPPLPAVYQIADELRSVIDRALAADRDARFKTAHEMRVALDAYVSRADPSGSISVVGSHLARHLAADRKKLKDVVDERLHSASSNLGAVPILSEDPLVQSSPELSLSKLMGSTPPVSQRPPGVPASVPPPPTSPSVSVSVSMSQPSSNTHPTQPTALTAGGSVPPAAPPRKNGFLFAVLGVAAVAAAGGIFYAMHQDGAGAPPIAATTPTASNAPASGVAIVTSPPTPTDTAEGTVELSVRASPTTAQIFVDDALVDGNPFRGRFPKSGDVLHTVKVTAPGFLPKSEIVKLDANNSMTFSLERHSVAVWAPPPPPPPPRAPEPAHVPTAAAAAARDSASAAPAKTTDINLKGGKAPKREIDPKNPYGTE